MEHLLCHSPAIVSGREMAGDNISASELTFS